MAVAVHHGPFSSLGQTYGVLGTYVAEREIGVDGPIRAYYAVTASQHVALVTLPVVTVPGRRLSLVEFAAQCCYK